MKKIAVKILLTLMILGALSGATFSARHSLTDEPLYEQAEAVRCAASRTHSQTTALTTAFKVKTTAATTAVTTAGTTVEAVSTGRIKTAEIVTTAKNAAVTTAAMPKTGAAQTTQADESEAVQADGDPAGELKSLGKFKITFYCGGACCNGKWAGKTCTGNPMIEGRTIAVDKNVIPLGSSVYIEGFGWYVAEDVGGGVRGKHIDIYLSDHARVDERGVCSAAVYIK